MFLASCPTTSKEVLVVSKNKFSVFIILNEFPPVEPGMANSMLKREESLLNKISGNES